MTSKTDNISNVMTAVEKSDLAFKTLLAIRSKLMGLVRRSVDQI